LLSVIGKAKPKDSDAEGVFGLFIYVYGDVMGAVCNRDQPGSINPIIVVENHSHRTLTSTVSNLDWNFGH